MLFDHSEVFVFYKVGVHDLGELLRMLLLQVKCEKLDLFLKKSLTTEKTEGVSVHGWRADMRQCGRSGEHYAADKLGVMIHQVLGTKAALGNVVRDKSK